MLSEQLEDALNEQIKNELYSAYLYLAMAAQFEADNLGGFAQWMRVQAEEEQEHAMKFFHFINERGGRVELRAIEAPPLDFGAPLEVFERTLEHEKLVTSLIDNLYALAVADGDYASQVFLHWFISEQVEEEANATQIVEQLRMVTGAPQALLSMDARMGERGD